MKPVGLEVMRFINQDGTVFVLVSLPLSTACEW